MQLHNFHYQSIQFAAIFSFAAFLIGGTIFLHPFTFSNNSYADTSTTTNGTYYIETTSTDLNLAIHTTPAGNQEVASHNVVVKTNDPLGYTLSVSVNNDTSNALNLDNNTNADINNRFNATSGTYTNPTTLDTNTWGFADTLAKKNNDAWAAVPLLSQLQQLKQTSSANEAGDSTTLYYAINAKYDGLHPDGNYSNTITYSVVGNTPPAPACDAFTICYDGNGADGGEMGDQTTVDGVSWGNGGFTEEYGRISASNSSEVNLRAQNFWRKGYGFSGWNTKIDGTGDQYGPMETIDMSSYSSSGLVLYANWVKAENTSMQDWGANASSCANLNTGGVIALTDTRENKKSTYAIAKLADGKCWMIENLRLGSTSSIPLTTEDSNLNKAFTLPASSSYFHDRYNDDSKAMNAHNIIDSYSPSPWGVSANGNGNEKSWFGYGNYYNWHAANPGGSICPKNWHLPKGKSGGDYSKLSYIIGGSYGVVISTSTPSGRVVSKKFRTFPNNFLYASDWTRKSSGNRGLDGYYWTSDTTYDNDGDRVAYHMLINANGGVDPGISAQATWVGMSVRCISDNS